MEIEKYLQGLESKLIIESNWQKVIMNSAWRKTIPSLPGVYALREGAQIVYVGETGNLKKRMGDLMDSRHHTVRRTIGETFFSSHNGFIKATSKLKFPDHIEILVNDHICTNLMIAFLPVSLGRKELEERIQEAILHDQKLNKRGRRK